GGCFDRQVRMIPETGPPSTLGDKAYSGGGLPIEGAPLGNESRQLKRRQHGFGIDLLARLDGRLAKIPDHDHLAGITTEREQGPPLVDVQTLGARLPDRDRLALHNLDSDSV